MSTDKQYKYTHATDNLLLMKTIREIVEGYDGPLLHKWSNYIDIYDSHFSKYRGQEIVFLEIGISHGGSLKLWREYFGPQAKIYAIDIDPDCKKFETANTKIFTGSQEDVYFLKKVKKELPPIDILLDDGGHTMRQQIVTFNVMFDHVKENGIYACEDTHTSYFPEYGGGLKKSKTFIEFCKNHIDELHGWYALSKDEKAMKTKITSSVWGIHFYDSIVLYIKKRIEKPYAIYKGHETVDRQKFIDYGHKQPFYKFVTNLLSGRKK